MKHCHILTPFSPMLGAHRGGNSLAYLLLGFRMAGFARFNQKNEASSRYMKRKLIAFLLAVAPFSLAQAQQQLAGDDLQKAVAGKTVFIDTPLGEVPVRYAANGSVSARTELALLDGEVDHGGPRPLVGVEVEAVLAVAELDGRQDALLHDAPPKPDGRALAPRRRQERHRAARLSRLIPTAISFDRSAVPSVIARRRSRRGDPELALQFRIWLASGLRPSQ